jgi:hypothetical protein
MDSSFGSIPDIAKKAHLHYGIDPSAHSAFFSDFLRVDRIKFNFFLNDGSLCLQSGK